MNEKQIEIRRQRNLRKKEKVKINSDKKRQYDIFASELHNLIVYYKQQIYEISNYKRVNKLEHKERLFYYRKKQKKINALYKDILFLIIIEKGYINYFDFKEIVDRNTYKFENYKHEFRRISKGFNYKEEIQKKWNIRKEKRELNRILIKVSQNKKRSRL